MLGLYSSRRPRRPGADGAGLLRLRRDDFRDRFRRSAHLLGYVTLRSGLLIATSDRWEELIEAVPDPPAGSQVLRSRLSMSTQDSLVVATDLWSLEPLGQEYRRVLAKARTQIAGARQEQPQGVAALRCFADTTLPIFDAATQDPDLPEELLPSDWPGKELSSTLGEAFRAFGPLLEGYMEGLTGNEGLDARHGLAGSAAGSSLAS